MDIRAEVCFRLAKRRVLRHRLGQSGANPASFDKHGYSRWRQSELEKQFVEFFSPKETTGFDVLDFGCGEGGLSVLVSEWGARSVTGVEISEECYRSALSKAENARSDVKPCFVLATKPHVINLPDSSFDVILCFDVLEHVMEYERIVREWRRILRRQGKVLIWWAPWWHPYGPHIESLVPIPWSHLFFTENTLLNTCARIYDMPEFVPRIWDLDASGKKKPNKWLKMQRLPEVNKLTMHKFESLARRERFLIAERNLRGFSSPGMARISHAFLRVPLLREFFTSCVAYKLVKAEEQRGNTTVG